MDTRFDSKEAARGHVWDRLKDEKLARFPFPPHGRIPNFKGAEVAARRLFDHPLLRDARCIKVNPDAPQRPVRVEALRRGVVVHVPTPRLRGGFKRFDPARIPDDAIPEAASLSKGDRWAQAVALEDLPQLDAIVAGSVAVTRTGRRAGKGEGYSDLEFAILRELGHAPVPVATTVHPAQIVERLPADPLDLPLSLIVTPGETIAVADPRPPPRASTGTVSPTRTWRRCRSSPTSRRCAGAPAPPDNRPLGTHLSVMTRMMPLSPLDEDRRRAHKLRNLAQSALLLFGMLGVFALAAATIFGWQGVLWATAGGALGLAFSPRLSPRLVLRMYRGREIGRRDAPDLVDLVEGLAQRAGLHGTPSVFYLPSQTLNAFTVGGRDDAVVAITDGMLRALSPRELAGVLAHEMSHIRNHDTWVMGLADAVTRLTRVLSFLGLLLLVFAVPWMMMGGQGFPWLGALLLMFAPTIGSLLQLALSRTREYEADLDAAGITGDPEGLAMALQKLERRQGRFWEEIVMPGRRMPDPSILRTHPRTEERVARLMSLARREGRPYAVQRAFRLPGHFHPVGRPPRMRWPGVWY